MPSKKKKSKQTEEQAILNKAEDESGDHEWSEKEESAESAFAEKTDAAKIDEDLDGIGDNSERANAEL